MATLVASASTLRGLSLVVLDPASVSVVLEIAAVTAVLYFYRRLPPAAADLEASPLLLVDPNPFTADPPDDDDGAGKKRKHNKEEAHPSSSSSFSPTPAQALFFRDDHAVDDEAATLSL